MSDDIAQTLRSIETKLTALLTIASDEVLRERLEREEAGGRYRMRTLDRMLADSGMSGVEIGQVLGKSQQAVSQALAKDKKAAAKPDGKKKVASNAE